jgi:hypothetical protein
LQLPAGSIRLTFLQPDAGQRQRSECP